MHFRFREAFVYKCDVLDVLIFQNIILVDQKCDNGITPPIDIAVDQTVDF